MPSLVAMDSPQHLPPDTNQAPTFLGLYYALTAVALTLILVRSWVRARLIKHWGWDDSTIIVAWLCLLAGLVLVQIEANLGLGRHVVYLEDPERQALQILRFNTFFQIVNVLCTLTTKISICIFILRLKNTRTIRWVLVVLMLFMLLATIQVIVVLCISCRPMRKIWTPEIPGTCLPLKTVYYCAYVQSAFTIVTDLALTASPVVILWKVKISQKQKVLICGLMSLGLGATICNSLRNAYQETLTTPDFTHDIYPVTILAIIELSSGVIAACIPACMPLIKWTRQQKPQMRHRPEAGSLTYAGEHTAGVKARSDSNQTSDVELLEVTLVGQGDSDWADVASERKLSHVEVPSAATTLSR